MNLTPAQYFRKHHTEHVGKLAIAVSEPWFMAAVSATLAEMAHNNQAAAISGANEFLATLRQLPEDAPDTKPLPSPHLKSYEPPTET